MEKHNPALFDEAAAHYPHRISYAPSFFEAVSRKLKMNKNLRLLDIACGTGNLAIGFSNYCGDIIAVDQSQKMLDKARAKMPVNVTLMQWDVNRTAPPELGHFDVITIGRALRYLERDPLFAFLERVLKVDGTILICNAGISSSTIWGETYAQILRSYQDMSKPLDPSWRNMFHGSPFQGCGNITSEDETQFSIDDLVNNALSYNALSERLRENSQEVFELLSQAMQPFFNESKMLTGAVFSTVTQFRRRGVQ